MSVLFASRPVLDSDGNPLIEMGRPVVELLTAEGELLLDAGAPVRVLGEAPAPPAAAPPTAAPPSSPPVSVSIPGLEDLVQQLKAQTLSGPAPAPVSRASRARYKEPSVFDGTKPHKLRDFLNEFALIWALAPGDFPEDQSKILYIANHLEGAPRNWFNILRDTALGTNESASPTLVDQCNLLLSNYEEFTKALRLFGDPHPEERAAADLDKLVQGKQSVMNYGATFQALAYALPMSDWSRTHKFYQGLDPRIKDIIAQLADRPTTLDTMISRSDATDKSLRRRAAEVDRDSRSSTQSPRTQSHSSPRFSSPRESRESSSPSSGAKPASQPRNNAPIVPPGFESVNGQLRITKQERQRRLDNDLCLRCSQPGHQAANCDPAKAPKIASLVFQDPLDDPQDQDDDYASAALLDPSGNASPRA